MKIDIDTNRYSGLDHVWLQIIKNIPTKYLYNKQFVCKDWYRLIHQHRPNDVIRWSPENIIYWKDFYPTEDNITITPTKPIIISRYDLSPSFPQIRILYHREPFFIQCPWMRSPFGAQKNFSPTSYSSRSTFVQPPRKISLPLEYDLSDPDQYQFHLSMEHFSHIVITKLQVIYPSRSASRGSNLRFENLLSVLAKTNKNNYNPTIAPRFRCYPQHDQPVNQTEIFSFPRPPRTTPSKMRVITYRDILSTCLPGYYFKPLISFDKILYRSDMFFWTILLHQVMLRPHQDQLPTGFCTIREFD